MAVGFGVACPKPEPRKRVKGRKDRAETKVQQFVRAQCVERDGGCRLGKDDAAHGYAVCRGESEWAHLGTMRRARTRGLAPEVRHTVKGSLMLCTKHHQQYDAGVLRILVSTREGANGPLEFIR